MFAQALIDNSIFISLLKKTKIAYCRAESRLGEIYKYSLTNRLIEGFWERLRANFQYSFLNRITQESHIVSGAVLDNSRIVKKLLNIYGSGIPKLRGYLKASIVKGSITTITQELYFSPLRIMGIILVISVSANIFFSILLNKEAGFWGWIFKLTLLFLGTFGLYSPADYKSVSETSFFIRYVNNHCKIQK